MPMPVAPVNEHYGLASPEDHVRLSREVIGVQAVSEAKPMKEPPNDHLWLGILGSYPGHQPGPFFG